MLNFEEFCDGWVNIWLQLRKKGSTKYQTKLVGKKFEEYILKNLLSSSVPRNYSIAHKGKIKGLDHKFDFLYVKSEASDFYHVEPSEALAVFEVNSHGIFGYDAIRLMKSIFEDVKRINPQIKLFYVTFKETNTYDRKVREIFGNLVQHYYRLSDSGDGIQMPPPRYFPDEWNRLTKDLFALKEI